MAGGLALFVGGACSSAPPSTFLKDMDLTVPPDSEQTFDRNQIVDDAAFVDFESLDAAVVQAFFHKTPYDTSSFLETYQSNGLRAADAVARAARAYRINPLVFLVLAETTQGLLGEVDYPFPPNRVEYVFGCGCSVGDDCDPALAGFDKQVDCVGRSLREALDAIGTNGTTTSGWGPDVTMTTLDNLKVTPSGAATAALYDHLPVVHQGQGGGSWIFWNVYNVYATGISYAGPIGGSDGAGWIGDACTADATCGYPNATCATEYPDGLCTTSCTGSCPSEPDKPEAFCAVVQGNGFCFEVCNPGDPDACRAGYVCVAVQQFQGSNTDHVCSPSP